MSNPAIIEIVQKTHTYTATVRSTQQLLDYCGKLVREGKPFRIGSIYSYGDLDLDDLVKNLTMLSRYGTYDKKLKKEHSDEN